MGSAQGRKYSDSCRRYNSQLAYQCPKSRTAHGGVEFDFGPIGLTRHASHATKILRIIFSGQMNCLETRSDRGLKGERHKNRQTRDLKSRASIALLVLHTSMDTVPLFDPDDRGSR